jgi:hypothetical protein
MVRPNAHEREDVLGAYDYRNRIESAMNGRASGPGGMGRIPGPGPADEFERLAGIRGHSQRKGQTFASELGRDHRTRQKSLFSGAEELLKKIGG